MTDINWLRCFNQVMHVFSRLCNSGGYDNRLCKEVLLFECKEIAHELPWNKFEKCFLNAESYNYCTKYYFREPIFFFLRTNRRTHKNT